MQVIATALVASVVMVGVMALTGSWLLAQATFCAIIAFTIAWTRQPRLGRSVIITTLAMTVSTLVAKVAEVLLAP